MVLVPFSILLPFLPLLGPLPFLLPRSLSCLHLTVLLPLDLFLGLPLGELSTFPFFLGPLRLELFPELLLANLDLRVGEIVSPARSRASTVRGLSVNWVGSAVEAGGFANLLFLSDSLAKTMTFAPETARGLGETRFFSSKSMFAFR